MEFEQIMKIVEMGGVVPMLIFIIVKLQYLAKGQNELKSEITKIRDRQIGMSGGCSHKPVILPLSAKKMEQKQ